MKRHACAAALGFLAALPLSYVFLCYIPPLRIKLAAPPDVVFAASLRHMAGFKLLLAVLLALCVSGLLFALLQPHQKR
nr:hypothetical protein [Maliibacterium massiliense]